MPNASTTRATQPHRPNRPCRRLRLHRRGALLVVALGLAWCGASYTRAQGAGAAAPRLVLDEAEVWRLAEALLADGEHYRAITEYKRLIHYFPGGRYALLAQQRIAAALLLGGEPRQALRHIGSQLGTAQGPDLDRWRLLRAVGELDLDADQPMPLRKAHLEQARADLAAISASAPAHGQVAGFLRALDEPHDVPHKSPALAGTLSAVVPGAGSVYVGRYAEGALSFFVNALLIAGTVTAFDRNQDSLGVGLGVLALAFYSGNIYAAASGAHKFNDRAEAADLEQQRVRFGLILEPGRIGAAFQIGF